MKQFEIVKKNIIRRSYSYIKVMKVSLFLCFFCMFTVFAGNIYSQGEKLTLKMDQVTLNQLLSLIEEESGCMFLVSDEIVDELNRKIDIAVTDQSVLNILDLAIKKLESNLSFRVIGKQIIIKKGSDKNAGTRVQPITVTGVVSDKSGPLPGVNVVVKGTTKGVVTDMNGKFSISVVNQDAVLVFSFIGYESTEVVAAGQQNIHVTLHEVSTDLDEVIVIGYGAVKKKDLTGSISSLKVEDMLKSNPISISQGMQGQIAGVMVSQSDGAPGAGMSIQVRGSNSFSSNSQPLYVIDGIPYGGSGMPSAEALSGENQSSNNIAFLNPNDIESLQVLKDASATAIYGARGANGVVLITTKKGRQGDDRLELSVNIGFSDVVKRVRVLNGYEYAKYQNEQVFNLSQYEGSPMGDLPYPGQEVIGENGEQVYMPGPDDYLNGYRNGGTDWQDLIFRTGLTQDYSLTSSGGNEQGSYLVSGNFTNQQGVIVNSDFKRYSIRLNLTRHVKKWMELGTNNSFSRSESNFAKANSEAQGVIRSTLTYPSTYPVYDDNQNVFNEIDWFAANPYTYTRDVTNNLLNTQFFSSNYLEFKLWGDYLKLRENIGYNFMLNERDVYYPRNTVEGKTQNGVAVKADNWWMGITSETLLTFDRTFDQSHHLNAVAVFAAEHGEGAWKDMTNTNFVNDILGSNNMGAGIDYKLPHSGKSSNSLISLLFRTNYSFKDRYLFTVSVRRDGSSKFHTNNKWATFPSFAFAWNATEESFLKDRISWLSMLKLRLSYGKTGNQAIDSYQTVSKLSVANVPVNSSVEGGFIIGGEPVSPDLRWETTDQYNVGFDLGFFNGRLNFSSDIYYKKTSDLLQRILIASSTGYESMWTNFGSVENKGLEFSLNATPFLHTSFKWNINANISFNRNKISGLTGDQFAGRLFHDAEQIFIQRNGQPIGALFGYVENGFYDSVAEVRADPQYANATESLAQSMVGEIKFKNFDDDPTSIGVNDRVLIGNTNPDFIFGFNNGFSWKGFTLDIFIQGVVGNDIVNSNLLNIKMNNIGNIPQFVYDGRWTPENKKNATWPKATNSQSRTFRVSDRCIEDGSYVRLKNLTLGYAFSSPFRFISSIYLYASVNNLVTLTKYSWYDPDVNAMGTDASRRGVDMASYPTSRSYNFGIRLGL